MSEKVTPFSRFNPEMQTVLRKMCEYVDAGPEQIDWGRQENIKDEYYNQFEWTEEQYNDFIAWLTHYVWKGPARVRNALLEFPALGRTKKGALRFAREFAFQHGWRFKKEES